MREIDIDDDDGDMEGDEEDRVRRSIDFENWERDEEQEKYSEKSIEKNRGRENVYSSAESKKLG